MKSKKQTDNYVIIDTAPTTIGGRLNARQIAIGIISESELPDKEHQLEILRKINMANENCLITIYGMLSEENKVLFRNGIMTMTSKAYKKQLLNWVNEYENWYHRDNILANTEKIINEAKAN